MTTTERPDTREIRMVRGADAGSEAARRLVDALGALDYPSLFETLALDARLRWLIPRGPGEDAGAADVAARLFGWFGDAETLDAREVLVERMADRTSLRYRFHVREHGRDELVEQQAYLDVDPDGRIATIDLLCSGFRPIPGEAEEDAAMRSHEFDAGTLGCSDGLAGELRRRIGSIPVGDLLVVTARDPAAKEDLPPLARMMGHMVHSIEAPGDGRLVITVERGR